MTSLDVWTDGRVAASAFAWRCGGRLYVTAAVRARFAIVAGGVARLVGPGGDGADSGPLRVPYRPRCDVTFVGKARLPQPVATTMVRLAVMRGGRAVLDKSMRVVGSRGPDGRPTPFTEMPLGYERTWGGPGEVNRAGSQVPNVIHPSVPRQAIGFAPLPLDHPTRRGPTEDEATRGLERPIALLPENTPWTLFQRAPIDQQVEPLSGGESLVLEALLAAHPIAETTLPSARGVARARFGRGGGARVAPFDLACDALSIDGEAACFELVWRGRIDLGAAPDDALGGVFIEAALHDAPADARAPNGAIAGEDAPRPTMLIGAIVDEATAASESRYDVAALPLPFGVKPPSAPVNAGTPWGASGLDPVIPARPGEETLSAAPIWSATAPVVLPWPRQEVTLEPGTPAPPEVLAAGAPAVAAPRDPVLGGASGAACAGASSAKGEALAASLRRMGVSEPEIAELVAALAEPS